MIRVAVLGGGIGAQHLDAYDVLDPFDVTHLVDQDADRMAALARPGMTALTNIDEAMAADVDIIDICLPPHLHAPVTIAALQAGKHVICEKPLATSIQDTAHIQAAAKAADKLVFPVFQYRYGPAFAQLSALRQAGLVGAPRAASLETHWNRGADYYAVPWRGTWSGEQGGAVLGHAIHAHDLFSHVMAPVRRVTARLGTLVNDIETEDTAAILFELDGGALATSSVTLGSATDETRLRLVFEHLTATSDTIPYAPGDGNWTFTARDPDHQTAVDDAIANTRTPLPGFRGFLADVAQMLTDGTGNAVTLAEGAASIELVTAIYASHRANGPVTLPLPPDHPMREGWQP